MRTTNFRFVIPLMVALAALPRLHATLLLLDDYSGKDTSLNNALDRQSGSLAPVSYLIGTTSNANAVDTVNDNWDSSGHIALNHNFIDAAISSGGGMVIELLKASGDFSFSIGHTSTSWNMGSGTSVNHPSSEFGLLLRQSNTDQFFIKGSTFTINNYSYAANQSIRIELLTTSFAAGAPLDINVFVDGTPLNLSGGTPGASTTWGDANANYLAFGRNPGGVVGTYDNLSIAIPEPGTLALVGLALLTVAGSRIHRPN